MGSAELTCASLQALAAAPGMTVCAVITQPDRPSGRKLAVTRSPVAELADSLEIPVHTPESVNMPESLAWIQSHEPDYMAIVAYGQILKPALLELPRKACVNVHTSLLPAYRGAAPIQWAVANGETETGVSTMLVSPELDAGDILLQTRVAIGPEDTAGTLHERLALVGADLLVETLARMDRGDIEAQPQDEASVSYAPRLKKRDGEIDWTLGAAGIYNRVRGFHPWPGCFTGLPGGQARLKIHRVRVESNEGNPGEVIDCSGEGPLVAAGSASVRLLEVQPEGRKPMSGAAYLVGHALDVGDVLGTIWNAGENL
jgi:methionyl-tRNA formyltransferase